MHTSTQKLTRVPLAKIRRPDRIDRLQIDPEEIEALAKSIESQGLLQPPILRPRGQEYEIVAGDRRILALRYLEREYVDAVIVDLSDDKTAEIRAVENLQRVDLTPIEEAKIYDNLHRIHHKSLRLQRQTYKQDCRLKLSEVSLTDTGKIQVLCITANGLWRVQFSFSCNF